MDFNANNSAVLFKGSLSWRPPSLAISNEMSSYDVPLAMPLEHSSSYDPTDRTPSTPLANVSFDCKVVCIIDHMSMCTYGLDIMEENVDWTQLVMRVSSAKDANALVCIKGNSMLEYSYMDLNPQVECSCSSVLLFVVVPVQHLVKTFVCDVNDAAIEDRKKR